MKLSYLKSLFVGLVLSVSSVANAGLITLTDTQEQTLTGQDFDFQFVINDWAVGTDAELFVEIQGDLGFHSETFDILFEELNLGTHGGFNDGYGSWTKEAEPEGNAFKASNSFVISNTAMQSLVFDNLLDIELNLSQYVHEHIGNINNVAPYVTMSFSYETANVSPVVAPATTVTEPSTIAIFGLTLLALGARRIRQ